MLSWRDITQTASVCVVDAHYEEARFYTEKNWKEAPTADKDPNE